MLFNNKDHNAEVIIIIIIAITVSMYAIAVSRNYKHTVQKGLIVYCAA